MTSEFGLNCRASRLFPTGAGQRPRPRPPWPTLLDERVGRQLPGAHVGVLLIGVLPVVVPLQRAGYVAGVMTMGASEGLRERGRVRG